MTDVSLAAPVHLVKGDDEVLLRDAAHRVVHALAGDLDPGLAIEEVGRDRFAPPDASDTTIVPLIDAAQTPPFLTDRRVVVGRDIEMFTKAAQVAPLVGYLADPLPTTSLVLVWSGGRIPKALTDAVAASGGVVVDTSPGRKLAGWVDEQVAASGLRLDRAATERVAHWLGDDPQRLVGVLATLVGAFGESARLGVDDVEPFLGEAGGVPPWELTDAIDKGDIRDVARQAPPHDRAAAGRHALQIMATLQTHYGRMLCLDGADVAGEKEAAARARPEGLDVPGPQGAHPGAQAGPRRGACGPSSCWRAPTSTCAAARPGPTTWCSRCSSPASPAWRADPTGAPPDATMPGGGPASEVARMGCGRPARRRLSSRSTPPDRATSRDLRRAAAFLWITPLAAALSMRLMARRRRSSASSAPVSAAATAALVRVLSSERTALLRSWRTRFCWLRLIWLLMFATGASRVSLDCGLTSK